MTRNALTQDSAGEPGQYPVEWVEQVTLRDGLPVLIRPIQPEDARRLRAGFKHLSTRSVFLRFLSTMTELTEKQALSYATLDYQTQMAFVACLQAGGAQILIGVARYATVDPARPGLVECAVVVGDKFQRRGLGSLLLDRLIRYGREHGVTEILATVHSSNAQINRFLQKSGFPVHKKLIEPGVWEMRLQV